MAGRAIEQDVPLPAFLKPRAADVGVVLAAHGLAKSFGGIHAVARCAASKWRRVRSTR